MLAIVIEEIIMQKRKLASTGLETDGTFDLSPKETEQFAKFVGNADPGWYIVAIRPSGVNMEGPYILSDACPQQDRTPSPAYLFKAPEDGHVLRGLLQKTIPGELTFSFDVEDGEIMGGNFNVDGEVFAILRPGDKWRND